MHIHHVSIDTELHNGTEWRVITVGATTSSRLAKARREGWNLADEKTFAWAELRTCTHHWAPRETMGVHVMRGNPGREEALACLGGLLASAWEISDGGHDLSAARAKVVGRAV